MVKKCKISGKIKKIQKINKNPKKLKQNPKISKESKKNPENKSIKKTLKSKNGQKWSNNPKNQIFIYNLKKN